MYHLNISTPYCLAWARRTFFLSEIEISISKNRKTRQKCFHNMAYIAHARFAQLYCQFAGVKILIFAFFFFVVYMWPVSLIFF